MEPINENVVARMNQIDPRRRRAWGLFTVSVASIAAFSAFLNGTFLGSANSGAIVRAIDDSMHREFAACMRGAVSVPNDFATIQQAIDGACDGATIMIAPGIYKERIVLRNRTLHLWGFGGADGTRLIGDGSVGPIVTVCAGSVQCDGIRFQSGVGEMGRGASVLEGAARFTACQFVGNCGGAKSVDATIRFDQCEFIDNRAAIAGGAVQSIRSDIRMEGCTLRDNTATTYGGGMSVEDGAVQIFDTTLSNNQLTSGAWGGGLYAESALITMHRGAFIGNHAGESGAAAYLFGGYALMESVRFTENISPAASSVHSEQARVNIVGGSMQGDAASNFIGDVISDQIIAAQTKVVEQPQTLAMRETNESELNFEPVPIELPLP